MTHEKPLILVTERLAERPLAWLKERSEVAEFAADSKAFLEAASRAEGLIVRTHTRVTKEFLAALPRLKVVGRAGVGLDNIDLLACEARGIAVVNTPDANTQAVVEYVTSLLGWAFRPVEFLDRAVTLGEWERLRYSRVPPREIREMTLGVLGLGRVGGRLASVARAIGCRTVYNDIAEVLPARAEGHESVSLDRLFAESDILSLHIDGRPSNRHFVDSRLIGAMKPGVLLINTSRGMVLDADALARHLRAHTAARAILDVHDPEPFTADYPLLSLPNAHLAAHMASRTETAIEAMSWVVRDVFAALGRR